MSSCGKGLKLYSASVHVTRVTESVILLNMVGKHRCVAVAANDQLQATNFSAC